MFGVTHDAEADSGHGGPRTSSPSAVVSPLSDAVGIGHRTGLFDTMAGLAPSTSDQITERFETGEGVRYTAFAEFHRFMAEESAAVFDNALVKVILPLAPELPGRLAGVDVAELDAAGAFDAVTASTPAPGPPAEAGGPGPCPSRRCQLLLGELGLLGDLRLLTARDRPD